MILMPLINSEKMRLKFSVSLFFMCVFLACNSKVNNSNGIKENPVENQSQLIIAFNKDSSIVNYFVKDELIASEELSKYEQTISLKIINDKLFFVSISDNEILGKSNDLFLYLCSNCHIEQELYKSEVLISKEVESKSNFEAYDFLMQSRDHSSLFFNSESPELSRRELELITEYIIDSQQIKNAYD